jgi:hypothetical protein
MCDRAFASGFILVRPSEIIGRYKMVKHLQQAINPLRREILKKTFENYKLDGVEQINYTLVEKTLYNGFTHFYFDIGVPLFES